MRVKDIDQYEDFMGSKFLGLPDIFRLQSEIMNKQFKKASDVGLDNLSGAHL